MTSIIKNHCFLNLTFSRSSEKHLYAKVTTHKQGNSKWPQDTENSPVLVSSQGQLILSRMYLSLQRASIIDASARVHWMPLICVQKHLGRTGTLFSWTWRPIHLISLKPESLPGNESGNWNPSALFGSLIIIFELDFIIQCQ